MRQRRRGSECDDVAAEIEVYASIIVRADHTISSLPRMVCRFVWYMVCVLEVLSSGEVGIAGCSYIHPPFAVCSLFPCGGRR